MVFQSKFILLFVAITSLFIPFSQSMANDIKRFNADVQQLTGDWEAEPWHFGWLRLHQENYNEVADDFFLHMWEEERPKNKTAQQVLQSSFPKSKVGDVDDERVVSMAVAERLSGGVLVKTVTWNSQFGRYKTFFGVIPRPKGGYISFKSQCNFRPYKTATYTGDKCIEAVAKLLSGIQNGTLRMPRPEAPASLANWSGQITESGYVRLFNTGWFSGNGANNSAARSNHIYIAPAKQMLTAQERTAVTTFADATAVSGFGRAINPQWTGNILRRTYPNAGEGDAFQVVRAVTIPNGRKSVVSLSCWTVSWREFCMGALDRVVEDLESGFIEEKWAMFR